ncbi:hypothetical protein ACFYXC_38205 [Streptomyces sp. NPDC002701]|uniref:hypothetical protein n=1 Tax=Streptomyces sp. NPDC002701 TaxID=3364661 RepID=UPI0036BC9553
MEELREDHGDGTVARVAAIDSAEVTAMTCLRVTHDTIDGRRIQQVWNVVASTTNTILELGDRLICQGVERVVPETPRLVLAPVLLPAQGPRSGPSARQHARCEERLRPPEDRQAGRGPAAKLTEHGMIRSLFVPRYVFRGPARGPLASGPGMTVSPCRSR